MLFFELSSQLPSKEHEFCLEQLKKANLKDHVVLLEFKGILDGNIADLHVKDLVEYCYNQGASHVLKNTLKITTVEFKDLIYKASSSSFENIEKELIESHIEEKKQNLVKSLLSLDLEKKRRGKGISI